MNEKPKPSKLAQEILDSFGESTREAIMSHLKRGQSVRGMINGREVEIRMIYKVPGLTEPKEYTDEEIEKIIDSFELDPGWC